MFDSVQQIIRMWLASHLPDWPDITIATLCKYLGTFLGPGSGLHMWKDPISKWKSRVSEIAATGAPPSIASSLYSTHALPTLSYIAQLSVPPRELVSKESHAIARVLHVPPNSFSRADFFSMSEWGSVPISVDVYISCRSIGSVLVIERNDVGTESDNAARGRRPYH